MKVVNATSFKDRFFGLMFKKNIDVIMRFDKCNSIHTFFMYSPIDVYMTDKNGRVLFVFKGLSSNKVILPKKNVHRTYETKVGLWNYETDDIIEQ